MVNVGVLATICYSCKLAEMTIWVERYLIF